MSRNPAVVTNAVRKPLRSSTALVATVEPCARSCTVSSGAPVSRIALNAPSSGRSGVLGTLTTRTPFSSIATKSVNVPPTSTPIRITNLPVNHHRAGVPGPVTEPSFSVRGCIDLVVQILFEQCRQGLRIGLVHAFQQFTPLGVGFFKARNQAFGILQLETLGAVLDCHLTGMRGEVFDRLPDLVRRLIDRDSVVRRFGDRF